MKAFLTIIVLSGFLSSSAQVFKTGVILGLNGSQVDGDGYGGYNKLGFIVGGFTNTNISEKWSTQFEIYFINKGSFKAAHPDKGDYRMFNLNINYIEIPLSLRYKYHKFMLELGLYGSKFLSYHMEDEFGERTINQYPFKSFDFGGFIGIYYQLNDHFIFNLRYKNSAIPIRDFNYPDPNRSIMNKLFNQSGWYNVEINFSIRYQFGSKS
jgi:hypothetical protein